MNNENYFDIAVIGGGLAGLCVAIQSADAGYNVVLFEKEKYPFYKVCGEYISNESKDFLERIGFDFSKWNLPFINTLHLSDVNGKLYKFTLPLGGFGISRFTLDNELYKIALKKNVAVYSETKVSDVEFANEAFKIASSAKDISAKVVAGSFGKRSNLDVKLHRNFIQQKPNKLNNYIAVKYHVRYPLSKNVIGLHNFQNGYCGISNVENEVCCLCYLTTAANLQKNNNSVSEMEQKLLSQNPHLNKIFSEAKFLFSQPLTISQISFSKKTQIENHILMLGDAAGTITPLCGNGMSMAMHSSKLAFENMHLFLQNKLSRNEMEKNYSGQWQSNFARRLKTGRMVQKLFGGNISTSIFLNAMSKLPFLSKKIIQSTHGKQF